MIDYRPLGKFHLSERLPVSPAGTTPISHHATGPHRGNARQPALVRSKINQDTCCEGDEALAPGLMVWITLAIMHGPAMPQQAGNDVWDA